MRRRWIALFVVLAIGAIGLTALAQDAGPAPDAGTPDAGVAAAEETAPATPAARMSLRDMRLRAGAVPWYQRATSGLGLLVMVLLAWAISSNRRLFPWRIVLWGIGLQLAFGILVLKTPIGLGFFSLLNDGVARLLEFTDDGSRFLFGAYLDREFTVALNVLPTIIFFSALMSVLYHVGVMQWIVRGFAWIMQRTLKTSGAETLSSAANVFVGQTEAPLVVRPFVATMTQSELHAVMVGGFANVAGGVLAAYVGMLDEYFSDIAGHLIAASVLSAPASLLIAKVMVPETEEAKTASSLDLTVERPHANVIDAAAGGASDGLKLALNVGAMLLAFLALVAMLNYLLALPALWHNSETWDTILIGLRGAPVPEGCEAPNGAEHYQRCIDQVVASGAVHGDLTAWTPLSMQRLLGYLFWPIALVMGVPLDDCGPIAALLGEKMILNEFVAYLHLAQDLGAGTELSHRAVVIASYALCGFANIGSIAIQIGGIGGIAPERRHDLARLGLRAMIGGTLSSFMVACIAGMLV